MKQLEIYTVVPWHVHHIVIVTARGIDQPVNLQWGPILWESKIKKFISSNFLWWLENHHLDESSNNQLFGWSFPAWGDLDISGFGWLLRLVLSQSWHLQAWTQGFHGGIGMKFRCFQVKVQKDEVKIAMKIPTHGRIDETFSNTAWIVWR